MCVALRFIEIVKEKPNAVIALPTGKTPEFFIAYLKVLKAEKKIPPTRDLRFVQIDEFFPMSIDAENSFTHYINKHYVPLLGAKHTNLFELFLLLFYLFF